jgi:hypothetical protein
MMKNNSLNSRFILMYQIHLTSFFSLHHSKTVLRILICMFLSLLDPDPLGRGTDPDPDPLGRGTDLDPDPLGRGTNPDSSIIKKNLDSYCFVTSL